MKSFTHFSLVLLLGLFACTQPQEAETDTRPNILYILVDDMGYSDLGCYGSEINTPNLDKLAEQGLRFTKFYNAARCCPSRASLLTGLYPHQAGMGSMTQDFGHPSYSGYLRPNTVTIAELLQKYDYHTYHVGKWHVGEKEAHWPVNRGFDKDFTFINGASSYYNLWPYRKSMTDSMQMSFNGERYRPGEGFYMTDAFSDHAVEFIQKNEGKPFFMYLAYTAPHWPLHALPADIAKYKGTYGMGWDKLRERRLEKMKTLGVVPADIPLSARTPDLPAWETVGEEERATFESYMELYAAVVDRMDQGIGKVIQALEAKGELDNTLIVFLSDNGASPERVRKLRYPTDGALGSERSFPTYGPHWANASNTPYRFYKAWLQEGGMHSPFIVHWPNKIKAPGINTQTTGHIMDLMATALEVAGASYPESFKGNAITPTPGKSLLPAFTDLRAAGHETLYWEHGGARAVRQGDWKLVANKFIIDENGWNSEIKWQLFNLKADPAELTDLMEQEPERAEKMKSAYDAWAQEVGALAPEAFFELIQDYRKRQAATANH